jgi:hypothetical protein
MKKIIILLTVAAAILSFLSCKKVVGEGPLQTEDRAIANFNGLSTSIAGTINYTQAPFYKVQIQAQRNILDILESYRIGNELILKFRNNVNVTNHSNITVNISAPSLESLQLSGAANVNVTGSFVSNNFNTNVSGSGNLTINNLQIADAITARVSGSGYIKIFTGTAAAANAFVSGSGNIDLSAIAVQRAEAKISGSGNAKVNTIQTLDATISGSGDVYYWGNPVITTHISGSGKVIKL